MTVPSHATVLASCGLLIAVAGTLGAWLADPSARPSNRTAWVVASAQDGHRTRPLAPWTPEATPGTPQGRPGTTGPQEGAERVPGPCRVPQPWCALAACESGDGTPGSARWDYNGRSGYLGGVQFLPSTYSAYRLPGHPEHAWQATPAQQVEVARRVQAAQGWSAWPVCSRRVGLR